MPLVESTVLGYAHPLPTLLQRSAGRLPRAVCWVPISCCLACRGSCAHRLSPFRCDQGAVSLPDVWSRKYVSFPSVAEGHKALQVRPRCLHPDSPLDCCLCSCTVKSGLHAPMLTGCLSNASIHAAAFAA